MVLSQLGRALHMLRKVCCTPLPTTTGVRGSFRPPRDAARPPREDRARSGWSGPGSVVAGAARALGASLLGVSLLFHAHAHVALLAHLSYPAPAEQ